LPSRSVSFIVNRAGRRERLSHGRLDGLTMPPNVAPTSLRAVLVDDDELFAESLAALLAGEDGIDVIGWVSDGADAVDLVAVEQPDVVVMDLAMPRMNGVEAARVISRQAPDTRIILLSGSIVGDRLEEIAGETGATAYVSKARVAIDLVPALRAVAAESGVKLGPSVPAFSGTRTGGRHERGSAS
jgi:DNA-binding NarL/FixJ family response regulator